MIKKVMWLVLSSLIVVALVLASCGPAAEEGEKEAVKGEVTKEEATTKVEEEKEEVVAEEKEMVVDPSSGELVEKPRYGGTLTLTISTDPVHFDPYSFSLVSYELNCFYLETLAIHNWATDRNISNLMFWYFPGTKYLSGQLAESWENPDPLTYIFHLRKGVRWHNKPPVNGREFVSDDVVYSYGRMLGKGIAGFEEGSPYLSYPPLTTYVESIEATDKYTVVFKLSAPSLLILSDLTTGHMLPIVARDAVEAYGDISNWKHAVGTGPFTLEDYVSGSSLTYAKNAAYYLHDEKYPDMLLPYVDEVKYLIIPDMSTQLAAMRTAKIDTMRNYTWQQKEQLEQSCPELKWKNYYRVARALGMRVDLEPFTDIRVRKAMQMAINLEEVTEEYYHGNALPFPTTNGPGLGRPHYIPFGEMPPEVQEGFTYNPEKAKQLLAEAGYPNGFKTNIETRGLERLDLLELAQAYLADIGVDLEIRVNEFAAGSAIWYGRKTTGMFWSWTAIDSSPIGNLGYWYPTTSWNWGNVDDPQYNAMYEDLMEAEPYSEVCNQLSHDLNVYATGQFWVAAMPVEMNFTGWWPWVKGFQGEFCLGTWNSLGPVAARVWIDQDLEKEMGH